MVSGENAWLFTFEALLGVFAVAVLLVAPRAWREVARMGLETRTRREEEPEEGEG